ncbi:MAG: ABC transporter substrate-binding protein [Phycisphaerales bacterium]|nr:ABC transporter substrate-binding protein [Phycisphaerales bacterium]
MRVVSLVPSATELLCAMDGLDLLVGRSHECDWPPSVLDRPALTKRRTMETSPRDIDEQVRSTMEAQGSLHQLDADLLKSLEPDLILLQDTCGVCSIDQPAVQQAIDGLKKTPQTLILHPSTFEDVLDDLLRIGEAVDRGDHARQKMVELRAKWWDTQDVVNPYVDGPQTAVLEWSDPLWAAGHWTPQLIERAGGRQNLVATGEPSRIITPEDLLAMQVERLIIAPCGVPIDDAQPHVDALTSTAWWPMLPAVMDGEVVLLDGNATFSRPGPRLVQTLQWLTGWLQSRPELAPPEVRWKEVPSR